MFVISSVQFYIQRFMTDVKIDFELRLVLNHCVRSRKASLRKELTQCSSRSHRFLKVLLITYLVSIHTFILSLLITLVYSPRLCLMTKLPKPSSRLYLNSNALAVLNICSFFFPVKNLKFQLLLLAWVFKNRFRRNNDRRIYSLYIEDFSIISFTKSKK